MIKLLPRYPHLLQNLLLGREDSTLVLPEPLRVGLSKLLPLGEEGVRGDGRVSVSGEVEFGGDERDESTNGSLSRGRSVSKTLESSVPSLSGELVSDVDEVPDGLLSCWDDFGWEVGEGRWGSKGFLHVDLVGRRDVTFLRELPRHGSQPGSVLEAERNEPGVLRSEVTFSLLELDGFLVSFDVDSGGEVLVELGDGWRRGFEGSVHFGVVARDAEEGFHASGEGFDLGDVLKT